MEKRRTVRVISLIFIMLMIIRAIEIVVIKADRTWIGENILHNIFMCPIFSSSSQLNVH